MNTKFGKTAAAATIVAAVATAGCSTTRTFVDYSQGALYSTETVGNVPYVEVGPARASARGFFWENCWAMAEEAVAALRTEAERYGANTVSSVRWLNHADGTYTETPLCTTGWGWFTAALVGGFMPWVQVTEVQGRLVYADDTQLGRYRHEVARRSLDWQKQEAERLALANMSEQEKAQKAAEKAAAEKAAADKLAAEQAAAKAAAEKAAAEKAAAELESARQAKAKPASRKKKPAAKASAPAGSP